MSIAPDRNNHRAALRLPRARLGGSPASTAIYSTFGLTRREAEVLHWMSEGKRDHEIARIIGASQRTIEHHVSRILDKLDVETRTAAARIGLDRTARLLGMAARKGRRREQVSAASPAG